MSSPGLFYHEKVPMTVRVAGTLGITAAAFLAGQTAAGSYLITPAVLQSPAPLLAKQWNTLSIRGRPTSIGFVALGALFGGLAYYEKPESSAFKLYLTSAALILANIPYTIALMGPTNRALAEKSESLSSASITDAAAEAGIEKEETTHALVDKWATLNLPRAALAALSAAVALWANISSVEVIGIESLRLSTGAGRMGN